MASREGELRMGSLIDCSYERHAGAILGIFNEAIEHSVALYDYHPRPAESMVAWFDDKRRGGFPVIGIETAGGDLMGFGTWGVFRARPAYKYTVEHSVYVHHVHRGRGVGEALLRGLLARAVQQQLHVLVGGIDAGNAASIKLHEKLGFTHAGTVRQSGFKFGRWLDLAFYQCILSTPSNPVDG